jgi:hypothetical protein
VKINHRIHAACPGHAWSEMHVVPCMQEVGLPVVSSSCCHDPEAWCEVHLSLGGVLSIPWLLISCIFLFSAWHRNKLTRLLSRFPRRTGLHSRRQTLRVNIDLFWQGKMFGKSFVGREVSGWSLLRFRIDRQGLHLAAHSRVTPVSLEGSCGKKRLHSIPAIDEK